MAGIIDPQELQRQALWQGLIGLGSGLLEAGGPSVGRPVGLGQGLGVGLGRYQQAQRQSTRDAYTNQLLGQQGKLLGNQLDQQEKWNQMLTGAPSAAAIGAGMSQPGQQAGPTPQAAANVTQADPFAGIPPAQRAMLGFMPPAAGAGAAFQASIKSPKDKFITVGDQLYDVSSGKPTLVSEPAGPFKGTSMDAQTFNMLVQGDPGSPEYAASYARAAQPKVNFDQATGNWVSTNPDMSWARRPMRKAPASGSPSAPAAPGPQGDATTPLPGGGSITTGTTGQGKMNDTQSTSALYADRMRDSMKILDDPKITEAATSVLERGKAAIPGVGNFLVSKDYQKFEQAQRDFINATLRRESGAVISDQEFENARKQYFPQPGDSKDVIEQKKKNRQTALDGISRAAGPAYKPKADEPKKVLKYNPETGLIE